MRRLAPFIVPLLIAAPVAAHDFWLQPRGWQTAVGTPLPFTIEVGHGSFRERWSGKAERLVALRDITSRGIRDLRRAFVPGGEVPHLTQSFREPGLHVIGLATTNAVSVLPAIRFNDYLKVEGLTPAIDQRIRLGTTDRPGRELYSRRAKAFVQVGPTLPDDTALALRPIGLGLEIVPERNPYALGADRTLPVRIIYQGKPLSGALVKLTTLEFEAKPLEIARSDADGRVVFRVPPVGSWLVNVIWTRPIKSAPADYETIFSSLTFGYSGKRPPS